MEGNLRITILITGVSGFIGRSLAEEIVNRNLPWEIYGIDIKEPVFNDSKYRELVKFSQIDIRDENAVRMFFESNHFDGVIHLAAVSRVVDAEKNKENCLQTNYLGSKFIVDNVAKQLKTWMVFGSSREVYGEQTIFQVKESARKTPINIYGECKLKGELLVSERLTNYIILRFCNVYGNNYDIGERVIPSFVKKAIKGETLRLEGGDQIIDFTHINDTVDTIISSVELLIRDGNVQEVSHVSPGKGCHIRELVSIIENYIGRSCKIIQTPSRYYDVQCFIGDPTHRMHLFGNKNFVDIEEGVRVMMALN